MKALFLPSHVGLGHATRDAAVARELRRLLPGLRVEWCSAEPVESFLRAIGEPLAPGCRGLESFSAVIEDLYEGRLRGLRALGERLGILRRNWEKVQHLVASGGYDLVFADEFWELVYAAPPDVKRGVVFGTDLVYMPYASVRPLSLLVALILNRYFRGALTGFRRLVYLNDPGVVEGRRWLLVAGGRVDEWLRRHAFVAGLATSYLPGELPGRGEARRELRVPEDELLVVATVGGTSTRSRRLLDCVAGAAPLLDREARRRGLAGARLFVVTGPRTRWEPPPGLGGLVEKRGLEPGLHRFYAAADAFVTRAGRTTTADLLCAGVPAVLVPIEGHLEQLDIARYMERRHGYPVLGEKKCSPGRLVERLAAALARRPEPPRRLCLGTPRAARLLASMLRGGAPGEEEPGSEQG